MKDFTFFAPTRILFGKGKIAELPAQIKKIADKVLLVYGGGSVKRSGIYDTFTALLKKEGIAWEELSGVEPNPKIESVIAGAELCKKHK